MDSWIWDELLQTPLRWMNSHPWAWVLLLVAALGVLVCWWRWPEWFEGLLPDSLRFWSR
jgi:hypothetical protein